MGLVNVVVDIACGRIFNVPIQIGKQFERLELCLPKIVRFGTGVDCCKHGICIGFAVDNVVGMPNVEAAKHTVLLDLFPEFQGRANILWVAENYPANLRLDYVPFFDKKTGILSVKQFVLSVTETVQETRGVFDAQ